MKTIVACLVAFTAALLVSPRLGPADTGRGRELQSRGPTLGIEPEIRAELEPVAALKQRGKSTLRLRATTRHSWERASLVHAVEATDDAGKIVHRSRSAVLRSAGRDQSATHAFDLGGDLPDGYYLVRLTSAAVDGDRQSTATADLHLKVTQGTPGIIGAEEYYRDAPGARGTQTASSGAGSTGLLAPGPIPNLCPVTGCPGPDPEPPPPPPTPGRTGVVRGKLVFFNNNGNYCHPEVLQDCVGSLYPESQFRAVLPVRRVKYQIRATSNGAVLAQGNTAADGSLYITWNTTTDVTSIQARLYWWMEQDQSRFVVLDSNLNRIELSTSAFMLYPNTTTANPQQLGSFQWGSSGANANPYANVYDAAFRMEDSLEQSSRMQAYFSGVRIQAFDQQNVCPTSCAYPEGLIRLDPGAAFAPQARIMHEMGHVATVKAVFDRSFDFGGNEQYCFNEIGYPHCVWTYEGPEHGMAQMTEGYATFLGDLAVNGRSMTRPRSCWTAAAPCSNSDTRQDEELPQSPCADTRPRWPFNFTRYLWDLYDTHQDYAGETRSFPYSYFIDAITSFMHGTGNHQLEEPWSCAGSLCEPDGRAPLDYAFNIGDSLDPTLKVNNCITIGD